MNSRKSRLAKNTVASLIFQVTTIVCGFILPRLILYNFGSKVNGLVNSITQFLSIIGFLELGVGAVVQSALYKPIAERNQEEISKIISSAQRFFRKVATILLIYICVLICIYPFLVKQNFGWLYTAGLILAMSISSFSQYYFGIVDRLFLSANQRGYIQYNAQTISLIVNTLTCVLLIKIGASIHIVKLVTSIIFLARPLALRLYINKNYKINRRAVYDNEPIKQKWNGVAQHFSAVILDSTDLIVLSVLSTLSNVSIYSVYHLVLHGVKTLLLSMTSGIQSLLGELLARREWENLRKTFDWTEWVIHTATVFVFGCTGVLLLPFISVYTLGVTDAQYIQPVFAVLITLAHAGHCLRLPYNLMILSGGYYKETQRCYIIAAGLNIIVSVIGVKIWGLIGVALGTLIAMSYQTIWMAIFNYREILKCSMYNFAKQLGVDALSVVFGVCFTIKISFGQVNYIDWFILALNVAFVWGCVVVIINYIFYRNKVHIILALMKGRVI